MGSAAPHLDPWWEREGEDAANDVCAVAKGLRDRQSERRAWLALAVALYDDRLAYDLTPTGYTIERLPDAPHTVLNLVESCTDTVHAELIQSRIRTMAMPVGGDWETRKKCRDVTKFLEGLYADRRFDRTASAVCRDSIVLGTGIVRVLVEDGKVQLERVMPWEIWVDEREGYYGTPQTIYQLRYVDRRVLAKRYKDHADIIETARSDGWGWSGRGGDMVLTVESWHLPSTPDAGDGKHVIAIEGALLFEEEWDHDWFPLVFMHWKTPMAGFWGSGLAASMYELQCDLNRTVEAVQIGQRLNTWPRMGVDRRAKINTEDFTDEPGTFFEYTEYEPKPLIWPAVPAEIYNWIESNKGWAYQLTGVSMAAARSERPAGLSSGRAIQLNADLQSKRFLDVARAYEQMHLDVGLTVVRVLEHHAANDNRDIEVTYRGRFGKAERIKWSRAKLDENSFVIRLYPVSLLPSTPAGRVDQIGELMRSGYAQQAGVPTPLILRALDNPDTESLLGPISAAYDLAEMQCEKILDGENPRPPEGFWNLSVTLLVGTLTYQQWLTWDVPEEFLDELREWLDLVRVALERSQGASQPAGGEAPAQPSDGAPAAPPAQMAA